MNCRLCPAPYFLYTHQRRGAGVNALNIDNGVIDTIGTFYGPFTIDTSGQYTGDREQEKQKRTTRKYQTVTDYAGIKETDFVTVNGTRYTVRLVLKDHTVDPLYPNYIVSFSETV